MPYPMPGEKQSRYVHRFMSSPEAATSFSNPQQRLAVAYHLFKQKHLANQLRVRPPSHGSRGGMTSRLDAT